MTKNCVMCLFILSLTVCCVGIGVFKQGMFGVECAMMHDQKSMCGVFIFMT